MVNTSFSVSALLSEVHDCFDFKPEPVSPSDVEECILEATKVYIHGLTRPGCFYFLGKQTVEALAKMNAERVASKKDAAAAGKKLADWQSVPGWLLVTSLKHRSPIITGQHRASCCCLIQSLRLLLVEKGIASAWTLPAITRRMEFALLCGINPEREEIVTLLRYGYPAEKALGQSLPEPLRHKTAIEYRP